MRTSGRSELAGTQIQMLERCQRDGTSGLDHQLVLLQHEQNHLVDVSLGDSDQIIQELVEQCKRQITRMLDRNALGGSHHTIGGGYMARCQRILPGRRTFRNCANHTNIRFEGLDGERHTGAKTATTERHHNIGDIRHIFKNFQTDGALTADNLVIVEWRHIDHALRLGEFGGMRCGFIEHITVEHHIGTIGLGGIHFQRRSNLRHADSGLGATFPGCIGHALRMVASGCGDDTMRKLLFGERSNLVICTTNLE